MCEGECDRLTGSDLNLQFNYGPIVKFAKGIPV